MAQPNPYESTLAKNIEVGGKKYKYYSLPALGDKRVETLPYSVRVLLESAIRNCDEFAVFQKDVNNILDWENTQNNLVEVQFKPARVILQDFTGVPAVVDLAAMRDAVKKLGGDPKKINPSVPVDLVIDHSVQVDTSGTTEAFEKNQEIEFKRNYERFKFLKWGSKAFTGLQIVPPGTGIVHQVNLEYLARVVFNSNGVLYPDSVVGTDSHTVMVNGLGVVGWGVGGIEAEAVMLDQPIVMVVPKVVGVYLKGKPDEKTNATDIVLTVTNMLRKKGVVGKFVEFYGPGVKALSLADRATIGNMAPEYGATMGYFPIDEITIDYLKLTGRDDHQVDFVEKYCKAQGLFREDSAPIPKYTETIELDLSTIVPALSGPKRPQDFIPLSDTKGDFAKCLVAKKGFKGFEVPEAKVKNTAKVTLGGKEWTLTHGSLILSAITSCTNTSNPAVMVSAGLLAKNAVEKGLEVPGYVKTSLSPGSGVVTHYLEKSGLQTYLNKLGYANVGYGCMTCIGNSGPINGDIVAAAEKAELILAGIESANRNFEGRVNPHVNACFLASPPLCIAFALAGRIDVDINADPLGIGKDGKPVFLKDIWPSNAEIDKVVKGNVLPDMFRDVYSKLKNGTERWNNLDAPDGDLYPWDKDSTYIHDPPFFKGMGIQPPPAKAIENAHVLLNLGDSVTTDHISPAGAIAKACPAQRYLAGRDVERKDFNSYGARRGNDEVMVRGTFANIRLVNKFMSKPGPQTLYVPTGETVDVFDAAERYGKENRQLVILAGAEYGSGSSRDWAAKGPYLLGVKAVIATSYERIHRSNLCGMGIVPLEYKAGESAESLGLTGKEKYTIDMSGVITPGQEINVKTDTGKEFKTVLRFDTPVEVDYYKHGGILHYVIRKLM